MAVIVSMAIFQVVVGNYLQKGKRWAWITAVAWCALGAASGLVAMFAAGVGLIEFAIIVLDAIIVALLTSNDARVYFRRQL